MSKRGEKLHAEGIEDRPGQVTDLKRHEIDILHVKIQRVIWSTEGLDGSHCFYNVLSELVTFTEKFRVKLQASKSKTSSKFLKEKQENKGKAIDLPWLLHE